jgi:ribonuclease P protein component
MAKRDFRLQTPEDFRRALRSRPAGRSNSAVIYRIALDRGFRLGFVVPKKLVRHANQRNRVKRWSRELFRECVIKTLALHPTTQPFALVVRLVGAVNPGWAAPRGPGRAELRALFEKATQDLVGAAPTSGRP